LRSQLTLLRAGLKLTTLIVLTAGIAAPAALADEHTTGQVRVQSLDAAVLVQLNAIRAAHGLVPLKPNAPLTSAAAAHSTQMLADGYFAHDSIDGRPFWKRLTRYTRGTTADNWSVGENLLWSSPGVDAAKALALWMASPEHERNILTARWRDIGIAAIHADEAPGTYAGRPVTVITIDFGVRH
jgi:uncharacterized protein YkwD